MLWTRKNYGEPGYEITPAGLILAVIGLFLLVIPLVLGVACLPLLLQLVVAGVSGAAMVGWVTLSYCRKMRDLRAELVRDQINGSIGR
jgi:hypothetical protein